MKKRRRKLTKRQSRDPAAAERQFSEESWPEGGFAILYRQIPQKCCTCRNNPHPGTRICLVPVAGPKDHLVCLQGVSCIGTGCCRTFPSSPTLSRFFLTFHSSISPQLKLYFFAMEPNSDAPHRCSGINRRASSSL